MRKVKMRFVCLIVGVLSMALFGDAAELKVSHRASQTAGGGRDAASPFSNVRPVKEDTKVETLVDFSKAKENDFSMVMGAFLDRRAPKQFEVGPHGLTVRVDDAREKPGTPWATMAFPRSLSSVDFAGRSFVLVFAGKPQGRITRNIALNVTDANGETFQFEPKSVESDRTTGDLRFVFDTASLSGKPGWGGKVNDGKMDRPARLSGLNFHYRRSGSGECVLKSVESVPAESASLRTTVSVEPISTDVQLPGAAPFHGAQELVFVVEPAFVGRATLTLLTESKGMAIQWQKVQHEADSDMGRIVFPVRQSWTQQYQFLELKCGNETAGGELGAKYRIVRAEGRFLQTKAEAMRLEVDTKNELHICRDESERPELLVTNPCAEPIAWKTEFVLSDIFGREIKIPFERLVAAGETVRVPVPWPLPAKGLWFVNARVLDVDGSVAEKETRFAFIDRHETTPLVDRSKFRFGIHYHGTMYWPDKIDKTIAALVAAGAKFTRCDNSHMWADIEPRPGEFHWEKSDAMIDKLRAAGLSLDIIIQNIPSYAFDPETLAKVDGWRKKGYRVRGSCLKTKPGLFRDFCEKYARRYGTKIDYYEVGNEWDLSSTESFPHEVALAIQREAYEGLHAGCPNVCVTPNGWAYPFTEPNATPDRWNLGIMEFFADHPEVYDCWALHCHGSFAKYVNYLDGGWKDLRERTKMKTRGWISNETANSVAFGNEIPVSRQVWQKPLWAWSRGCEAYIWYNLRATGWFDEPGSGYGVITADFHPRATYAAFAALTAIFQNLDFDGAIHSYGLRNLLRFRGTSQVLAEGGRVLAGWDDAAGADEIRLIRIRTDAKSAELSDHMGNRTPVKIEQGVVVFPMTLSPQALILRGASFAEAVDAKELTRPLSGPKRIDLSQRDRAPDFTITDKEHFRSFYEANPPFAHRLWTNAADLSAKVWFDRADGRPIVRVEVCDDKPTSGDRVEATVETSAHGRRTFALERVSVKDGVSVYSAKLPMAESSFGFDLRVHEDDGEGPDGYLMLCREGEDPVPVELLAPRAEVADPAVLEREDAESVVIRGKSGPPQFVLDTARNVKDLYEANPAMAHRLWKGPADHSARIWLEPDKKGLRLRALVRDDMRADGDGMEITTVDARGRKRSLALKPVSRRKTTDVYKAAVPVDGSSFGMNIVIRDDDGEGVDSFLFLRRESEDLLHIEVK